MQFFRQKFLATSLCLQRTESSRPFIEAAECSLVKLFLHPREETGRAANLEKLFNSRPVVARFIPLKNSLHGRSTGVEIKGEASSLATVIPWSPTAVETRRSCRDPPF